MFTVPEVISKDLINGTPEDKRELKDLINAAELLFLTKEEITGIFNNQSIYDKSALFLFLLMSKKQKLGHNSDHYKKYQYFRKKSPEPNIIMVVIGKLRVQTIKKVLSFGKHKN